MIKQTFPTAKIQRCLVHISRNIAPKIRVVDRKEILEEFKEVYHASKLEEALLSLETFTLRWKRKYPRVNDILDNNKHLLTYFNYSKEIRHSIYSTNLIEGFNKQLKKKYKLKEQFPTEISKEKYLVPQFNQYNEKFMNRIHKGFGLVNRNQWFPNY